MGQPLELPHLTGYLCLEEYDKAVEYGRTAMQKGAPWPSRAYLASVLGHLGRHQEAEAVIEELRELQPSANIAFVQKQIPIVHQTFMDHFLDGLHKAGLLEG